MKLSPTELEAANELADHITRAMVVAGRKVGQAAFEMVADGMPEPEERPCPLCGNDPRLNKGTKSAETGGEETL